MRPDVKSEANLGGAECLRRDNKAPHPQSVIKFKTQHRPHQGGVSQTEAMKKMIIIFNTLLGSADLYVTMRKSKMQGLDF